MEPELSPACSNPIPSIISPALRDAYGRWSPKSWTNELHRHYTGMAYRAEE